ncbi:IPT/TIG domain-containing protein [Streptomyces sp. NPDC020096]
MAPSISSISPTSGHSGQTMTISGTGLGSLSTTKVNVGTKTVTPTAASSTTVTLTIPSGCTGQANVSATVSGVNSNSMAFFYVAAPTCTSVSPSIGPAAPATAVDIFGSGFSTATSVAFGTVGSVAPTILSDAHITATPPAHGAFTACTDAADVLITGSGGTSTAIGPSGQFTYYQLPTVTSVTPGTGPAAGTTGVIVAGTCFVDVSSVTLTPIGGGASTPASNVVVTGPGSLTLDVPALTAGTYDIQVVTPGGTSTAVVADQFIVT